MTRIHRALNISLLCNKYLTHPTNELKPLPLPSLHSSFTQNWKHCSSAMPILINSFPLTSELQTPSTIDVRLSDCLPLWRPAVYRFVLVKLLRISWFPRLRFCGRCGNLEFTISAVGPIGLLHSLINLLAWIRVYAFSAVMQNKHSKVNTSLFVTKKIVW